MEDFRFIKGFSICGYRSFASEPQEIPNLAKVNLFIGQNNSGKSNILSFIQNVYPNVSVNPGVKLGNLDRHIPTSAKFSVGLPIQVRKNSERDFTDFDELIRPLLPQDHKASEVTGHLMHILERMAEIENSEFAWFYFDQKAQLANPDWEIVFKPLSDHQISNLWRSLTSMSGGSRGTWIRDIVRAVAPKFAQVKPVLIPAIRKVGSKGSTSEDFSGEGIIERLAQLQNPNALNQNEKLKFRDINSFLQTVTGHLNAELEIPHERDTILVHIDGKTLPLQSLGTGIHEVVILASAATVLENTVICMEEPELHLNPILQKKLIRYLLSETKNQYFITTHSAALMDTPEARIYQVSLEQGASKIREVSSDKHKSEICESLGYHPSDLLQSNCIIWVEGPSDRIYVKHWLNAIDSTFIEGIHYSVMFYGGRLASHISGSDIEDIEDFISLRRINRKAVILIDSDKKNVSAKLNETKKRLKDEFDQGPGFAWITSGREIENYLNRETIENAIRQTKPSATIKSNFGRFDSNLSVTLRNTTEGQASKVDVANYISGHCAADLSVLDLRKQITKLLDFIRESNPQF